MRDYFRRSSSGSESLVRFRGWRRTYARWYFPSRTSSNASAPLPPEAARSGTFGGSTLTRIFIGLAEGCLKSGRVEAGLEIISEALTVTEISAVKMFEAESWRLRGELTLLKDGATDEEVEGYFRSAIGIADRQSAKSWELRATVGLARLLARTGRRGEARTMLSEIYNWFTEGFDTADLKDAKTLLDELNNWATAGGGTCAAQNAGAITARVASLSAATGAQRMLGVSAALLCRCGARVECWRS
jgi:hypothetical protein